jgi:hypothetical protein
MRHKCPVINSTRSASGLLRAKPTRECTGYSLPRLGILNAEGQFVPQSQARNSKPFVLEQVAKGLKSSVLHASADSWRRQS